MEKIVKEDPPVENNTEEASSADSEDEENLVRVGRVPR